MLQVVYEFSDFSFCFLLVGVLREGLSCLSCNALIDFPPLLFVFPRLPLSALEFQLPELPFTNHVINVLHTSGFCKACGAEAWASPLSSRSAKTLTRCRRRCLLASLQRKASATEGEFEEIPRFSAPALTNLTEHLPLASGRSLYRRGDLTR